MSEYTTSPFPRTSILWVLLWGLGSGLVALALLAVIARGDVITRPTILASFLFCPMLAAAFCAQIAPRLSLPSHLLGFVSALGLCISLLRMHGVDWSPTAIASTQLLFLLPSWFAWLAVRTFASRSSKAKQAVVGILAIPFLMNLMILLDIPSEHNPPTLHELIEVNYQLLPAIALVMTALLPNSYTTGRTTETAKLEVTDES